MATFYKTTHRDRNEKSKRRMRLDTHGLGIRSENSLTDPRILGSLRFSGVRGKSGIEIEMNLAEMKELHAMLDKALNSTFVRERDST